MVEFTRQDESKIRDWCQAIQGERRLTWAMANHARDDTFRDFVRQLAEMAPLIKVKKDGDATVSRPTLFVGAQVRYQALPRAQELDPFLDLLGDGNAFADRIPMDARRRLETLDLPALFKVYVTSHCPFCPATVGTLLGLSAINDLIRVTIIDGEMFTDLAEMDQVRSAPTVILDDQFRWTGSVDAGELVALMLDRDPVHLGAEALKGVIEAGNAGAVAQMMADRQSIFPAFIDLLVHPRWSVRLGAMVAFETLAETDPKLAGQVIEPVMAAFAAADDMVKGDLAHVLGESANAAAVPFLSAVLRDEHDAEVKEAAREAMEKLL